MVVKFTILVPFRRNIECKHILIKKTELDQIGDTKLKTQNTWSEKFLYDISSQHYKGFLKKKFIYSVAKKNRKPLPYFVK